METLFIMVKALFNASVFKNIRFYVLCFALVLALLIHVRTEQAVDPSVVAILGTQYYALIAVAYLYFALLVGPLTKVWRGMPFSVQYLKARRAIGVSAFFFASLHAHNAFFDYIGGWDAYWQLPTKFHIAIALSFAALLILTTMAFTSFDIIIKKLTFPKWKKIHQLIYIGGIFVVIHAALLGRHIGAFGSLISDIFFIAVGFLLLLHLIIHLRR